MLEFDIQDRFMSLITGKEPIEGRSQNRINLYKELVFYRFYEVIQNAFPLFVSQVGAERLREMVASFIKTDPKSPYIWTIPRQFSRFVIERKLAPDVDCADDLLWYEWIEIELFRGDYNDDPPPQFGGEKSWGLSPSARMRRMRYRVYNKQFNEPGDFAAIVYYNFEDSKIHFQEITPFLFDLINLMGKVSTWGALHELCRNRPEVEFEEAKPIVEETFRNFCLKKILVPM